MKTEDNILTRLKRDTAEHHRQTESLMPFNNENFSLEEYLRTLIRFYAFYSAFEPLILQELKNHRINSDYQSRLKPPDYLQICRALELVKSIFLTLPAHQIYQILNRRKDFSERFTLLKDQRSAGR